MLYYDGIYGWESVVRNYITPNVVFAFYLGCNFDVGKVFNSPLRKDENPSFTIFEGKEELMYKDFATGDSGNCIKFVQNLFNINKENAVIKILADLFRSNVSTSNTKVIPRHHSHVLNSSIELKSVDFQLEDVLYWSKYHISKDTLKKYDTICVSHVWVNEHLTWERTKKEPIYAYLIDDRIKVYRPFSKKIAKWVGNTTSSNVFGYKQLPDSGNILIITKSGKDVMVLSELGYNAVAPNSETSLIPTSIIDNLKSRFSNIYVLMDNDSAGIKAGKKYSETYNLKDIYLNKEKDISDYIEKHTLEETAEILQKLCNLN